VWVSREGSDTRHSVIAAGNDDANKKTRKHHPLPKFNWALFSSEKISDFATVALSFLFDKYCPIMN
jgi:hypothetical protein